MLTSGRHPGTGSSSDWSEFVGYSERLGGFEFTVTCISDVKICILGLEFWSNQ